MFILKENRVNLLGSAVFVLLICLFLCAFAENPERDIDTGLDFKYASEFYSGPEALVEVQ
jgi:hypothetical protein